MDLLLVSPHGIEKAGSFNLPYRLMEIALTEGKDFSKGRFIPLTEIP
jgi:hypothetical protein